MSDAFVHICWDKNERMHWVSQNATEVELGEGVLSGGVSESEIYHHNLVCPERWLFTRVIMHSQPAHNKLFEKAKRTTEVSTRKLALARHSSVQEAAAWTTHHETTER